MSSGQEVGEIFGSGTGPATALLRSPTVIIASVGLWGMNVYLFRLFRIDYIKVLTLDLIKEREADRGEGNTDSSLVASRRSKVHDSNNEVTAFRLVVFSLSILALLHFSTKLYINVLEGSTIGAIFAFYTAVAIGLAVPLQSTEWIRVACGTVGQRALELVNPRCFCLTGGNVVPRAIPFIDVFFADAMCSLSKVFFDWGMLWHLAWHYPEPVPTELHSILIPSVAASLPYLIRARQCLVMYTIGFMKNDPKKYQHMLNAIKYTTSLWPLCVSAYEKTVASPEEKAALEKILIALLAINSTYSLVWDIVMDWGMMQNPQQFMAPIVPETCVPNVANNASSSTSKVAAPTCAHAVLRPRLRFGATTSVVIVLVDTILRYSWLLRFWEHNLFPSNDMYVLCTQFLEALRRALWNLLRVEWENIKQNRSKSEEEDDNGDSTSIESEFDPFIKSPSSMEMTPRTNGALKKDGHVVCMK